MTQLYANMPDGRTPEAPRQLGTDLVSTALSQMTPDPASPDMLLAREAVALAAEGACEFTLAAFARQGAYDEDHEIAVALAAIRLAREARS